MHTYILPNPHMCIRIYTYVGNSISDIEPGEIIYGQSFCCIKFPYTKDMCDHVLEHLAIMEAHIFHQQLDGVDVDVDRKILDPIHHRRRHKGNNHVGQ